MNNVDVVCVNWGDKYPPHYVERLFHMVTLNTTYSFKFYCLTDKPEIFTNGIIGVELKPGYHGWWNKMQLFREDVLPTGQYLYFDLDVVIVDNIDCLFDYAGFGITRDFINPDSNCLGGKEYNSSVMRFTQNQRIWDHFINNQPQWEAAQAQLPFFGDQNVISDFLNRNSFKNPFPDQWIWSYKVGTLRGRRPIDHSRFFGAEIPEGGKVCVFHGKPSPHEVESEWVDRLWKNQLAQNLHSQRPNVVQNNTKLVKRIRKGPDNTAIIIDQQQFSAPNHWFWDEFGGVWEPQTERFFQQNLIPGTDYLDVGAWIGPTAMIATALGAKNIKLIEPNPINFLQLLITQTQNQLFSRWFLINVCISNSRSSTTIGPLQGILNSSSATNIRNTYDDGAKVITLKLSDIVTETDNFSLVKIDIEGAEDYIIEDLSIFSDQNVAVWLSIHPPFINDVAKFYERLVLLNSHFHFVDEDNRSVCFEDLKMWITTDEEYPSWGTKWGNFFEIGLLSKKFFADDGNRIVRAELED